jgi:hypothetical protein
LVGRVQERYGIAKEQAQKQVDEWLNSHSGRTRVSETQGGLATSWSRERRTIGLRSHLAFQVCFRWRACRARPSKRSVH